MTSNDGRMGTMVQSRVSFSEPRKRDQRGGATRAAGGGLVGARSSGKVFREDMSVFLSFPG